VQRLLDFLGDCVLVEDSSSRKLETIFFYDDINGGKTQEPKVISRTTTTLSLGSETNVINGSSNAMAKKSC
jgi:hypothetical protein